MNFTYCASKSDCVKAPSTTTTVLAILVVVIVYLPVLLLFYFFLRERKLNSLLEPRVDSNIHLRKQGQLPDSNRTSTANNTPSQQSVGQQAVIRNPSTIINNLQSTFIIRPRPPAQAVRQPQRVNHVILPVPPRR
mgnify:CR=1 FL=1